MTSTLPGRLRAWADDLEGERRPASAGLARVAAREIERADRAARPAGWLTRASAAAVGSAIGVTAAIVAGSLAVDLMMLAGLWPGMVTP